MEDLGLYRAALDALTDHICIVDRGGKIVAVNDAWRSFGRENGCEPRFLSAGCSYYEACLADGRGGALAAEAVVGIRAVLAGDAPRFDLDYPCHSPSEERWFTLRVTALADGRHAVVAHENVTDRVKNQRAVVHLEEQFRQAQKMEAVGRLAAGIAHDFNNLLMGIRGSCELGRRRASNPLCRGVFDEIANAAVGGSAIVEQLMAFSRRDGNEGGAAELDAVLRRNANLFRRVVGEAVQLELDLRADNQWVPLEVGHLDQILLNLLINAREAMPAGGQLEVRTRSEHGAVRIEVEDTGVGMDPKTRERIFEPFFTTREPGQGTGLGLSTVYGLIHSVGGRIDVRTAPSEGTCFAVLVPDAPPPEEPRPEKPRAAHLEPHARVALVVEDEALVRLTVRMYLEDAGYRVLEAEDAAAAEDIGARAPKLDLILCDIVLPGGAGPEIVASLSHAHPDSAVLYMSAYPHALLVEQGRISEGTPSIQKPFDERQLLEAIGEVLEL